MIIALNGNSQEVVSTDASSSMNLFDFEITEKVSNSFIRSDAKISKLGVEFNTAFHEMGPILSPDGKTLFFSRYNHSKDNGKEKDEEDIWYSERNDLTGGWCDPKPLGYPFNNSYPNYVEAVASNGKSLLLGNVYLENGDMERGLSISRYINGEWTFPERLKIDKLSRFTEWTGSFLSNDERVLVMSCSKKALINSHSDLYVSFKKADGSYSNPVNMGKVVNSSDNELSPFMSLDGNSLFFSSNKKNGYGGYDIYMTTRLDESYQNWSPLQNLGSKVNSEGNECFFSISNFDNSMYYVSESDNGDLDIYTILKDNPSNVFVSKKIEKKINNEIENSTSNYLCFSDELDQMMVPLEFELNSSEFDNHYIVTIQSIVSLMQEYPTYKVLITGHCDSIGDRIYNEKLSLQRAYAIEKQLLNMGIEKARMFVYGMGESQPKYSNETFNGRKKNRRVELSFFN